MEIALLHFCLNYIHKWLSNHNVGVVCPSLCRVRWVSYRLSVLDLISGFNRKRVIKCAYIFFRVSTVIMCWLSMNLFFPGKAFFIYVTLPGTPILSFCFLWIVSLTFKVKRHRTIFPLQIRVRHENVSGFT